MRYKKKVLDVLKRLEENYGPTKCYLDHDNAWQLLIATILSAQCTDDRVNMVTKDLFKKHPDATAFANAFSSCTKINSPSMRTRMAITMLTSNKFSRSVSILYFICIALLL